MVTRLFDFEYTFHPVGQGLFASGCLRNPPSKDNKDFHWVFDCGSKSKDNPISTHIQNYKDKINNDKHIDLLCISHFHEDHVNGLKELLKDITIDTIVIPHYNPFEKLLLGISQNYLSVEYRSFLSNNLAFILENAPNVDNIIIVCSPDDIENGTLKV